MFEAVDVGFSFCSSEVEMLSIVRFLTRDGVVLVLMLAESGRESWKDAESNSAEDGEVESG